MKKIAIIYGSSSGTTQTVAEKIQTAIPGSSIFDAANVNVKDLNSFDFLILGTSTYGMGDLLDDWETLLPKMEGMNFENKQVAIFGLGDSSSFSTTFTNAMAAIYNKLKDKVQIVGQVSTDSYTFDESESVIDGNFVGLALDEDNEYNKTDERIKNWLQQLNPYFN